MVLLALALLQHAVPLPHPPSPIRSWLLTAPVPTDTGSGRLDVDYLGAARGGEAAAFPDSSGAWRPVLAGEDGLVDVNRLIPGPTAHRAVYAFSYVHSPREATRRLIIASDDDVLVWLNGQRIHRNEVARGTEGERDTIDVRLAAGWNALLLKVLNRQGGFGYGAWLDGDPVTARHRRPPDATPGNLPAEALTVSRLALERPLVWRGGTLEARATARVTAWGRASPPGILLRLVSDRDTLAQARVAPGSPGAPAAAEVVLDFASLALAALREADVVAAAPVHTARRSAGVDPAAALALLDGRIDIAGWRDSGAELRARVTVPPALAGLSLDLLAGEFGAAAGFVVNGTARQWRLGVVSLCDPCAAGDTLAIRVRRDTTRPWWDPPRARIRDRTYSDLARNARLLPALDSSLDIPPPDPDAWLAAMLEPDKARYGQLAGRYGERLAAHAARFRRDTIHLVGHSHIDAAWRWRAEETRQVVENTWRSALKIQQKFPGATFAASSAVYYRWLERQAPALLDSIRAAARRGAWSPVGGWWVEADQNLPSGESLVRQGLYGQRAFERLFGERCTVAWTPDSFGYPWTLPQIWRGLGLRTFVTQKLRWNDSTEFPHDAFVWEGRDGTRLFTYNPWGYDHDLEGRRLARELRIDSRRTAGAGHMLVLYGVGDHGGGPTIAMLERAEDLRRVPAFPILLDDTPERALQTIRRKKPEAAWPVWRDELYLEYHRGTYTTQAEMKRRNRRGEELLGTAEMLAALDSFPYPRRALEGAWHQLLFNQFHDLLPGSGIRPIYDDALLAYDSSWAAGAAVRDQALARLAASLDTRGTGVPIVVFNPTSWVRSSYVAAAARAQVEGLPRRGELRAVDAAGRATPARLDGDSVRFFAREVPPLGFKAFWIDRGFVQRGRLDATTTRLENDWLLVEVDTATGQLTRVVDKTRGREALPPGGRGNVLQLVGDRPEDTGETWVLDSVRAVRAGGDELARWIEVEKPWNATRIVQRIVLRRDEPWVLIENDVDWRETRKLLKVAFDLNVRADSAWYEIPYGAIGQPVAPRTPAERAKYEHPGHRWGDLSDTTFGVSVLNDAKYGWDTRGNRMRLSLLRAPVWPDSLADRGRHTLRYALYPHVGGWRDGETVRRGVELNWPMPAVAEPPHRGALGRSWSFVGVDAPGVYVTALKRAEDGRSWVLRLVEWHGRPARATLTFAPRIARVRTANLLEDPLTNVPVGRDEHSAAVTLRPWEITTLLVDELR